MQNGFLVISDNRVIHKIPYVEIVHVESKGMRSNIHTCVGAKHSCCKNLGVLYKELEPSHMFCRVHTSYAINLNHIATVKKTKHGLVVMSNGMVIPISKRRKSEFYERHLGEMTDSK